MGLLLRFLSLIGLFIAFSALGQTFEFKLEGSYSTRFYNLTETPPSSPFGTVRPIENSIPAPITPIETSPIIVNYTITWNESANSIQGVYEDNYFSSDSPNTVTGTINSLGRTFNVLLPAVSNGIKTITIKSSQTGSTNGSIPTDIQTLNNLGTPVETVSTSGIMSKLTPDVAPSSSSCSIGFGLLTGFCGLYAGTMNEISDPLNHCDLVSAGNIRLELATNRNFTLFLRYNGSIDNIPYHQLGSFIATPEGQSVAVSRRNCGVLPGTNFPAGSCQVLNLNASFFNSANNITVSGNYTITDEFSNEGCSYSFFLTRDVIY